MAIEDKFIGPSGNSDGMSGEIESTNGHGLSAHDDTLSEAQEDLKEEEEEEQEDEEEEEEQEDEWQEDEDEDDETHNVKVVEETELEATGTINGHEYVDLGLSVKWATCNVGASSPEDYGDYFAWGETSTKDAYNEDNCMVLTDKDFDEYICGSPAFDAARANWGGTWRLPTEEEMEELVCNCTWIWATLHDWEGYKVTGPNGRSIFLPAAGCRIKTKYWFSCESGCYWTSTPQGYFDCAFFLGFDSEQHIVDYEQRHCGLSVRAVAK